MPVSRSENEAGFTMIMTTIGLSLIAVLVLAAVTAVRGDIGLTGHDYMQKRAYEAAKAGINEYAYNLHIDNGYWAKCADKATKPHALNPPGKTDNRRPVPGGGGATYAIEILPATGQKECDSSNISTATITMLESLGEMKGSFRIRSTGFAGKAQASVTATFKPASFLDYVYFTQLETSDPNTYGDKETIKGAAIQCSKTLAEKRNDEVIPYSNDPDTLQNDSEYCRVISFVQGDFLNGPVHTNDAFVICKEPVFGRGPADSIEVSSPPLGWYETEDVPNSFSGCNGKPVIKGTYRTNAPVLVPPTTNAELEKIVEPSFHYQGQVHICLSGETMTVNSGVSCTAEGTEVYKGSFPENGVVYIKSISCSGAYTPFAVTYPASSECGNVYVHGSYSGQLTIAASNDIILDGDLVSDGDEAILGLIANNFIRIYHPMTITVEKDAEGKVIKETVNCANAEDVVKDIDVHAALLAINHSFIVDNYTCGSSLGTLTVKGAISQKYRGAVGTTGGTGYLKSYNYDDRLHTITPPSFIEPVKSDWVIGRETVG